MYLIAMSTRRYSVAIVWSKGREALKQGTEDLIQRNVEERREKTGKRFLKQL